MSTQAFDHSVIFGVYDYEWSAIGSFATAFAAIIALSLPFLMKWLDRRAADSKMSIRYKDIITTTYIALECFNQAIAQFNDDRRISWESIDLTTSAARASSIAHLLRNFSQVSDLTSSAIKSCVGAIEMMEQIVTANYNIREVGLSRLTKDLEAALALAHEARESIEFVSVERGELKRAFILPKNVFETVKAEPDHDPASIPIS